MTDKARQVIKNLELNEKIKILDYFNGQALIKTSLENVQHVLTELYKTGFIHLEVAMYDSNTIQIKTF